MSLRFIATYYAVVYFSERNVTQETLGGGAGSLGERSRTTYGRASVLRRELHDDLQVDLRHRILKEHRSPILLGAAGSGMAGANHINARAGEDEVIAGRGADTVLGGAGDDEDLVGGLGADTIYGGSDEDWIEGRAGADTLFGGDGYDDDVDGRDGVEDNDFVSGGSGLSDDCYVDNADEADNTCESVIVGP